MKINTGMYLWGGRKESLLSYADEYGQGFRSWRLKHRCGSYDGCTLLAVSDGAKVCWFLRIEMGEGNYWTYPHFATQITKHEAARLLVGTGVCREERNA